jgi:hypothetical protein
MTKCTHSKWGEYLKRHFSTENKQMANWYTKMFTSLKIKMRYYLTPVKIAIIKEIKIRPAHSCNPSDMGIGGPWFKASLGKKVSETSSQKQASMVVHAWGPS